MFDAHERSSPHDVTREFQYNPPGFQKQAQVPLDCDGRQLSPALKRDAEAMEHCGREGREGDQGSHGGIVGRHRRHVNLFSNLSVEPTRKTHSHAARNLRILSGDEGDRTPNLKLAKLALSQLSYVPDNLKTRLGVGQFIFRIYQLGGRLPTRVCLVAERICCRYPQFSRRVMHEGCNLNTCLSFLQTTRGTQSCLRWSRESLRSGRPGNPVRPCSCFSR